MSDARLYERVERRAFELWEQDGRPEGRALDDWLRAEAEVAGTHAGAEAPPGTPGAGEHGCPRCRGSGRLDGGPCPACGGAGRVVELPQP